MAIFHVIVLFCLLACVYSFVPGDDLLALTLATSLKNEDNLRNKRSTDNTPEPESLVPRRSRRSPGDEIHLNTTLRHLRSPFTRVRRSPGDEIYLNTTLRHRRSVHDTELNLTLRHRRSVYNTELNATLKHDRSKRSDDMVGTNERVCCGEILNTPQMPTDCAKLMDSGDGLGGEEKTLAQVLGLACAAECADRKMGLWDGKEMKLDAVLKSIKDYYPKQWTEEIVKAKFESCKQFAIQKQKEVVAADETYKCNVIPFMIDACLFKAIELGCPKDELILSQECNQLRKRLEDSQF